MPLEGPVRDTKPHGHIYGGRAWFSLPHSSHFCEVGELELLSAAAMPNEPELGFEAPHGSHVRETKGLHELLLRVAVMHGVRKLQLIHRVL